MAADLSQELQGDIPLAEMIQTLRNELEVALFEGRDRALRFQVEAVDLEVQVKVTRETQGNGRVKFWVVEAGAVHKRGEDAVHTVRLKLRPMLAGAGKGEVMVSDTATQLPK